MNPARILTAMVLIVFLTIPVFADTWTTSEITGNTVWTKNNSSGDGVWVVDVPNDTLIVKKGATLTIEPGVTVKFHDDVLFMVYGSLIAEGTSQDSIIFTMDDAAGSATEWSGIKLFSDSATVNKLIYCRIEKGDADIMVAGTGTFEENGGGIFIAESVSQNTVIKHNTIQNNKAYEGGGGLFIAGSPKVEYNLIRNNTAGQYGGGVAMRGSSLLEMASPSLKNNIIIRNHADGQGGGGIGIFANTSASVMNDLIYGNSSLNGSGGGVFVYSSSSFLDVKNTIIRGNSANSDNQVFGVINATYSNIEGGYSGEGNIDADPQFSDPANDDFHFEANSPVVDAGTNTNAPAVDFDGEARPFDGDRDGNAVVDMGPYEYQNTAPVITSTPVTEATEDQLYSYQVVAEDPDADETLTYSLLEAPGFLSIDSQTGLISGTPQTDEQAGAHTVTVRVADLNNATDTQTYTLNVTAVNDAPVVSGIPDQTIDEGESFATINLDNYADDEDNDDSELTWTYSGNLQLIVTIENHIATISAPDSNWYGSETITFTATDPGGLSGSDSATFTVNNINDAPVVSDIPDQTINEGESFATINLDNYVNDIDNVESDLQWTYSGNKELSVTIDENHVATVTAPDADWYGSETITFTATDPGGLSDSDPATFTVNAVNDAPVVSDIPDQTIDEGNSFVSIALDDYAEDVDNTDDQLTWTYSGNKDLTVVISADHIATISTPDADWFGSETITFRATDPEGAFDEDAATFTVNNINDNPVAVDDSAAT
ncbi:MAG: tandem-95 repeat protein, partial [Calditrichaeota bacterium]|nr:tandem-95 repeat protein [Calditrichota bacterium]